MRGDVVADKVLRSFGDFNSRPCVRGDGKGGLYMDGQFLFQFTPLREGRPVFPATLANSPADFNSRPCVRGDVKSLRFGGIQHHFNSRPCVRGDLINWPAKN